MPHMYLRYFCNAYVAVYINVYCELVDNTFMMDTFNNK